jgi:hypothetical protein
MWSSWDFEEISQEIELIAASRFSAIRILVPYSQGGWGGANPPAERLNQLYNLVNLCGGKGIYSIVTLFDWETTWPTQDSSLGHDHLSYIRTIVTPFATNPYIL